MTISDWIDSTRPKTLAAAFVPVGVGAALAYNHSSFDAATTAVVLVCALLIQIATNFANDYFDFRHGADTDERIGFTRASATGIIAPETMLRAAIITFSVAFLLGLYLVWHGGWIILAIGVFSIICGVAYTGGPYPLAYNGLGDVFVFLFFGLVAVTGTYYVNTLSWSGEAFWASLAVGALCTNILVVNNLRDSETDVTANKRTLGVIFGDNALRWEYTSMLTLAFAIPPHFYFQENYSALIFLPLLTLPLALYLLHTIWKQEDKTRHNNTLELTARFMALYGVLFVLGIIL
ncbi:MAG: 1,4-dihydroxy-2-naphthoate polyprenyltransferase [Balneolales bacterium]